MTQSTPEHFDDICRPLRVGVRVGHAIGSAGTLGAFVRRRSDRSWSGILSTSTTLAPPGAEPGDYIHQPPPASGRILTGHTRIARLETIIRIGTDRKAPWDAATARLLEGVATAGNEVPTGGRRSQRLSGPLGPDEIRLSDAVAKLGSTTGLTQGEISATDIAINIGFSLGRSRQPPQLCSGLIEVKGEPKGFSGPGDAGAIVYRLKDGRAVGMLFASAPGTESTYLIPLHDLFEELDLEFVEGTSVSASS